MMSAQEVPRASRPSAVEAAVAIVRKRFGHEVPERRIESIEKALFEAFAMSGESSLERFIERLWSEPLNSPLMVEFVSRVTIKESYFFRDEIAMATLREVVLPRLIARNQVSRRLAIWSAGCSSGEETYTISILVNEVLGAPSDWDVAIVGTDVDENALRAARAGAYGDWSLRTMTSELRERYFYFRDRKHVIRDRYRRSTRFEVHNLIDEDASPPEGGPFHLVICRNVGIYLSDDGVARLYRKLSRAVHDDGIVITAPSDPRPPELVALRPILLRTPLHLSLAYVGDGSNWDTTPFVPPDEADYESFPSTIPAPPTTPPPSRPLFFPPVPPCLPPVIREDITDDDTQVDDESLKSFASIDQVLARAPLNATPYFARALLELERGAHDAAEAALRKVLYLAPTHAEAHFRLGLLCARRGAVAAARRAFFTALEIVSSSGRPPPSWVASIGIHLARLEGRR